MSKTRVSNISLTVSTVKVFMESMKFISEYDLWENTEEYLKDNGKTDMFVDYEVLFFFREMLEQDGRIDPNHRVFRILRDHEDPDINRFIRPSSKHDSA